MKKTYPFITSMLAGVLLLWSAGRAEGQWITQTFELKPGWNAVYLHVDASHATLQELIDTDNANPIQEVWRWNPSPSTLQFFTNPQLPSGSGTQWASWNRPLGASSVLQRLGANSAYLVRVEGTLGYTWKVVGKPAAPRYEWTTSGLNFFGFPTPVNSPPLFETFLAQDPELLRTAEVYQYTGGELGTGNPARLFTLRSAPLRRGEAFWMRAGEAYNRYFGPFELELQQVQGVHFQETQGQNRLRLRNVTGNALTVTLNMLNSEDPPAGQQEILQAPPVLVRGVLDMSNLTYAHSVLSEGAHSWTLAPKGQPGSEVDLVLGVNRFQMPGNPGDLYAGILRFTDSLNLTAVDIAVSAQVSSTAGLWVGDASVNQVRHYLKNYQKDFQGQAVTSETGRYVITDINTSLGTVARPYPLRLIVHSDSTGNNPVLLQRVFHGLRNNNVVLSTGESQLDPEHLRHARRISAVHLPWSASNAPWSFTGEFKQGGQLAAEIFLEHDDQSSNPFLHTYHPDHDNLNATFDQPLPQGNESYSVERKIVLRFTVPGNDFTSLTSSSHTWVGDYEESITIYGKGTEARNFEVQGGFTLNRISSIPVLTQP
jgi:hypothetical protein